MNKKLITMLVTFCFMLLLAPVSVMAATPTNAPIVIDVGGANVENENLIEPGFPFRQPWPENA